MAESLMLSRGQNERALLKMEAYQVSTGMSHHLRRKILSIMTSMLRWQAQSAVTLALHCLYLTELANTPAQASPAHGHAQPHL